MRVLITASRTWEDPKAIWSRLDQVAEECRARAEPLIVVHGTANGGDAMAQAWVKGRAGMGWPVSEDPHPAPWAADCGDRCAAGHRKPRKNRAGTYCPAAGMYRNEVMVQLGADLCLAFIRDGSSGATGCADLAEAAGISTQRITWEER